MDTQPSGRSARRSTALAGRLHDFRNARGLGERYVQYWLILPAALTMCAVLIYPLGVLTLDQLLRLEHHLGGSPLPWAAQLRRGAHQCFLAVHLRAEHCLHHRLHRARVRHRDGARAADVPAVRRAGPGADAAAAPHADSSRARGVQLPLDLQRSLRAGQSVAHPGRSATVRLAGGCRIWPAA